MRWRQNKLIFVPEAHELSGWAQISKTGDSAAESHRIDALRWDKEEIDRNLMVTNTARQSWDLHGCILYRASAGEQKAGETRGSMQR